MVKSDNSVYICDPTKATECKKTNCFINGGPCHYTVWEAHADTTAEFVPLRHSKWEMRYSKLWGRAFPTCPVCGNPFFATNYCANCGTDMRSKLRVQPRANEEEQP